MNRSSIRSCHSLRTITIQVFAVLCLLPFGTITAEGVSGCRLDICCEGLPSGQAMPAGDRRGSDAVDNLRDSAMYIFESMALQDGRIWGYPGAIDRSGSLDASDGSPAALRVGDLRSGRHYRFVLSFDTSEIPDNMLITGAQLVLSQGSARGVSPFLSHGPCYVDVRTGFFGLSQLLEIEDFSARATSERVGVLAASESDAGRFEAQLNAAGLQAINKKGVTQLRVYFSGSEAADGVYNYIGFHSGESPPAQRPHLFITCRLFESQRPG